MIRAKRKQYLLLKKNDKKVKLNSNHESSHINFKTESNNLSNDLKYLSILISDKRVPLEDKKEVLKIIKGLCTTQKIPQFLLNEINSIAHDKKLRDLWSEANEILNTALVYHTQFISDAINNVSKQDLIATREQLRVKRTEKFRSNILDLNLNQKYS